MAAIIYRQRILHRELPHQAPSSNTQQADSSLMSLLGTATCKLPPASMQPRNGAQLGTKHVYGVASLSMT